MTTYKTCACGVRYASPTDAELCLRCRREICARCDQPMVPRGHDARYPDLCGNCERQGRRPPRVETPATAKVVALRRVV